MSVHPPAPLSTFLQNPVLWDVMGQTARDQARRGKLTAWLARQYAGVWPARDDDLPGELWRPIPAIEGFDCSSRGRVRHYPSRVGVHAEREPTPEEPQRLLELRRKPGEWDDFVTLSGPDPQPETFAVSELVRYTFGEVAHGEYVRRKTGKAPEPVQEPDIAPTHAMPPAGPNQEQPAAGKIAAAGPPPHGDDGLADADVWRRVAGWPYDANRAGQVRSYHDKRARRITTTPQRILKPIEDPALGPCVTLCDGRGGSETVAVAELVRRVFGEGVPP